MVEIMTKPSFLNPIGAIPTLISLTTNYTPEERRKAIERSITVAGGVIIGFMFIGVYIFDVLGISISDFELAGGVLLFKVAFDMLQGKTSNTKLTADEEKESLSKDEIGVVPLGMPLLAGPGTITTTMIYFNLRSTGLEDKIMVFIAVILVILSAFIVLRFSTLLFKRLGRTGSMIISRVMGLLLAAIGVEFMANGIISIIHTI